MEAIFSSDSLMNSIYLMTNFIQVQESLLMFYPYCINFLATGLRFLCFCLEKRMRACVSYPFLDKSGAKERPRLTRKEHRALRNVQILSTIFQILLHDKLWH
jgi:hypothetical protein